MHNNCLVEMENTLNLWMENMNRKHSDVLSLKTLNLYEELSQGKKPRWQHR